MGVIYWIVIVTFIAGAYGNQAVLKLKGQDDGQEVVYHDTFSKVNATFDVKTLCTTGAWEVMGHVFTMKYAYVYTSEEEQCIPWDKTFSHPQLPGVHPIRIGSAKVLGNASDIYQPAVTFAPSLGYFSLGPFLNNEAEIETRVNLLMLNGPSGTAVRLYTEKNFGGEEQCFENPLTPNQVAHQFRNTKPLEPIGSLKFTKNCY